MKYLLSFILFCPLLSAQLISYDEILEYRDLCYEDSTLECVNVYVYDVDTLYSACSKYDIDLGMDPSYKETKEIWVHKLPTFEGFIEFINKKIEQKLRFKN